MNIKYEFISENMDVNDANYIFLLYMIYYLKRFEKSKEYFAYSQFKLKIKEYAKKDDSIVKIAKLIQSDSDLEKLFNDVYPYVNALPLQSIAEIIIDNCDSYFVTNKYIDDDLENVNMHMIGDKKYYGNVFIASMFVKKTIFDPNNVESVTYDFYDDRLNAIVDIMLAVKNIKHKFVKSASQEISPGSSFDTVFYMPPYRYPSLITFAYKSDRMNLQNQSYEFKMMMKLFLHLAPNGKIISTVSTGILNKNSDIKFKKRLIEKNAINIVIELPRLKSLSYPVSMLSLCHDSLNVKFIDASKFAQNIRRGINLDSSKIIDAIDGKIEDSIGEVSEEYLIQNDYDLTPHRFFENVKAEFVNPTPLKELVTMIYRGFQIPSSMLDEYLSEEPTKIKLLTLSDIDDSMINKSSLQSLKALDKKMEHYVIQDNDLVISCKGKTFKTAVVNIPYSETYVSTGSIIVIRCDQNKIDPTFLKIFLDSKIGVEALKRIQTGATILSLNPTKLNNLVVPLPSLAKQLMISSSYKYKLKDLLDIKETEEEMKQSMLKRFDDGFMKLIN